MKSPRCFHRNLPGAAAHRALQLPAWTGPSADRLMVSLLQAPALDGVAAEGWKPRGSQVSREGMAEPLLLCPRRESS